MIERRVREHALHRSLMDVAVIPVDERFLALEPREDDLPSARRLSGLDAKAPRRRFERIDDVGKAGRWSLRGGAVCPGTQPRECEGHHDLHVNGSSVAPWSLVSARAHGESDERREWRDER